MTSPHCPSNQQQSTIQNRFTSSAYQLIEKIGEGGFGEVYSAKQLNTDQIVAIKFLRLDSHIPTDKKQRYIQRFERETLLGSKLDHPNIVRLLDKGVCDQDLLYGVFEYIDGITLKQQLQQSGAIPAVEAANLMAQVLDALAHAHQQGIVHRDIKPANIMLRKTDNNTHVKVLDFSISAIIDQTKQHNYQDLTLTNETLGTPAYSAPEQLKGEASSFKTDLYVWGLVFIECLTGQPAFTGSSNAAIFHQQLSPANVPIPASLIGHPVSNLLRRILNKKPHERIDNASALYQQLNSINFASLVGGLNNTSTVPQTLHNSLITQDNTLVDTQTIIDNQTTLSTPTSERKQITVLAVSLEIEASDQIDLEISDSLLDDQFTLCQDIAIRFGGYHVGTLGNMVLCYFGYPNASDNDCRLAARAALEINSELNARNQMLKQKLGLQSIKYIGINTGLITQYSDQAPKGQTANFAIKLAKIASNNQILCSQTTKQQLSGYIEFKTIADKIYAIQGERQIEAIGLLRIERLNSGFYGRNQQLTQLQQLSTDAQQHLHSLHLHGEAGIGKSRLIFEFRQTIHHHNQLIAQCLPEQSNNALYPILKLIKQHYGLERDSHSQAVTQLKQLLATPSFNIKPQQQSTSLTLLCAWFNLPQPTESNQQTLDHQQQKQQLFNALACLLYNSAQANDSSTQPVLFIVEDLHWADPTTQEFLVFIHTHFLWQQRNILVTTSRQSAPNQLNQTISNTIKLQKLNQNHSRALIHDIFNEHSLEPYQVADELLDNLIDKTDGIPLFIEETINMLQQNKLVHKVNGLIDIKDRNQINQLPNNLRDTLQQKLDSLLTAKETAQIAAIIGRSFDQMLLAQACNYSSAQLQLNLTELLEKQLIIKQRRVDGDNYIFRHALIRDAAYDSIPTKIKQQHHFQLAKLLEQNNAPASQLAYHFAGAKQPDNASHYFILAGDQAAETFTHTTYINYYQHAIEQLQQLKQTPQQSLQLSHAFEGIGNGEIANGRHRQGRDAYQQSISQIESNKTPISAQQYLTIAELQRKTGKSWATHNHHENALQAYQQAEQTLNHIDDDALKHQIWLNINSARLNLFYAQGNIEQMRQQIAKMTVEIEQHGTQLQQAHFLHDQYQLQLRAQRYAIDENVVAMAAKAFQLLEHHTDAAVVGEFHFDYCVALYFNGQYHNAHSNLQQLLQKAQQRQDVTLITLCLNYLALCCRHQSQHIQCKDFAEQTLKHATQAGLKNYVACAQANLAWVGFNQQQPHAEQQLEPALDYWQNSQFPMQWMGILPKLQWSESLNQSTITDYIEKLLDNKQQQLPLNITEPLQLILSTKPNNQAIQQQLRLALNNAKQQGYL